MTFIKNLFGLLWALASWGLAIFKAKNTPEMKQAKKNQEEEIQQAKTNDAIEKRDTKEIQNELSE